MKRISNKSSWLGGALVVMLAVTGCNRGNVAETYNERAKTIGVKANMKVVQAAAENYFKDHTYMYPTTLDDDFKSYFPGGDSVAKKPGKPPINPFTGLGEWPVVGAMTDLAKARLDTPTDMEKGKLEYNAIDNGKNYGIRGGSEASKAITSEDAGHMGTLVYSRDDYNKPASP
jgi:hypothetical protein